LSSTYIQNRPTILKCSNDDVENLNPFSEYSGICNIQVDEFGNLWTTNVENNKGYIGYYSGAEWKLKEMEFANRWIISMKAEKSGRMWFGTENGVYIVK
jgi:ligand-binding sensor domain-containing protein